MVNFVRLLLILGMFLKSQDVFSNNKPDSIHSDCLLMINFFKSSLYENYGDSLAFEQFWNAHCKFEGNYILQVDRKKLYDIEQRIHQRTWKEFIIGFRPNEDWPRGEESYWESRTRLNASLVNAIDLSRGCISEDLTSTYYGKCLTEAEHPYLKHVHKHAQETSQLNSFLIRSDLFEQYDVYHAFREGNEEVQLLLTIYFWPYLCHCANIDVYSGKWRDELTNYILLPK